MCGIIVIKSEGEDVMPILRAAVKHLEPRGRDGFGVTYTTRGQISETVKAFGSPTNIVATGMFDSLQGDAAQGQTRYGTSGTDPFTQPAEYADFSMIHNGNDPRHEDTRQKLIAAGHTPKSNVDTDTIGTFAQMKYIETSGDMVSVLRAIDEEFDGALELCFLLPGGEAWVFRHDALRPIVYTRNAARGIFAAASELAAVKEIAESEDAIHSLKPGYALQIPAGSSNPIRHLINPKASKIPCPVEPIYLSGIDNVIDDVSVRASREAWGVAMARLDVGMDTQDAVTIAAPQTSLTIARAFADAAGMPFAEGITRTSNDNGGTGGRTFILKDKKARKEALGKKFMIHPEMIQGKKVFLLEDSIIRCTTLEVLLPQLWAAGAKEVHVRSGSPPFRNICPYGVNISTLPELLTRKVEGWEIDENGLLTPRALAALHAHWIAEGEMDVRLTSLRFLPNKEALAQGMGKHADDICTGCLDDDTENYPTEGGRQAARNALLSLGLRI